MNFKACLKPVPHRGIPPVLFLTELVEIIKALPEEIFEEIDGVKEIYSRMYPTLGPWKNILERKAAACETLRILAMEESGADWHCGEDMSAPRGRPRWEIESGAFQVSSNSIEMDKTGSLRACVARHCEGKFDTESFIIAMKFNHALAVEYVIRLLRIRTDWDGPIDRGVVQANASRAAQAEFLQNLSLPNI